MATVDLSDLSHSYPFLHLARKHGIDYSLVLRLASAYDLGFLEPPLEVTQPFHDIWRVCHAPWRFDMARVYERGL